MCKITTLAVVAGGISQRGTLRDIIVEEEMASGIKTGRRIERGREQARNQLQAECSVNFIPKLSAADIRVCLTKKRRVVEVRGSDGPVRAGGQRTGKGVGEG